MGGRTQREQSVADSTIKHCKRRYPYRLCTRDRTNCIGEREKALPSTTTTGSAKRAIAKKKAKEEADAIAAISLVENQKKSLETSDSTEENKNIKNLSEEKLQVPETLVDSWEDLL